MQSAPDVFRTATGQTGLDAYVFEATQIANAQRELNARMDRLTTVIDREAPALLAGTEFPDGAPSARSFSDYLVECSHAAREEAVLLKRQISARLAGEFLEFGDMDLHMEAGRSYHRLSDYVESERCPCGLDWKRCAGTACLDG